MRQRNLTPNQKVYDHNRVPEENLISSAKKMVQRATGYENFDKHHVHRSDN
jgi:hypothetical protein